MAADQFAPVHSNEIFLKSWKIPSTKSQIQHFTCGRLKRLKILGFIVILLTFALILIILNLANINLEFSNGKQKFSQLQNEDEIVDFGNKTLAEYLESEVRVFCWVMTSPKNHKSRALHVKNTWGKRCTKLLFVTTQEDPELDTLIIDIEEKYENIWGKTRNAFKYLYENHLDEFDWFMKADDDTYVFMENLRYMLYSYSPETPVWFGFSYKLGGSKERHRVYMAGGSGYTLSREALRRFGDVALNSPTGCKINDNAGVEDAEMGICLHTSKVFAADSRDTALKFRYAALNPLDFLIAREPYDWFRKLSFFHLHLAADSLSNLAVAFHYITPEEMHMYEYLAYGFEVAGLAQPEEYLPRKLRADEVIALTSDNDWGNE